MSKHSMEAVLPLIRGNAPLACLLVHSLDRFAPWLSRLHVICPDSDVAYFKEGFSSFPNIKVHPETSIFPESKAFLFCRKNCPALKSLFASRRFSGWYLQQVLKLAAATLVETDFYLTLDSDMVAIREIPYEGLVTDGRAVCLRYELASSHPEWYEASAAILNTAVNDIRHGVTPALLNTSAVHRLADYIQTEGVFDLTARLKALLTGRSWRSMLMQSAEWTEYSLYFSFLESQGVLDYYHKPSSENVLYKSSVFTQDSLDEFWNQCLKVWQDPDRSFFTVVQSTLEIGAAETWDMLNQAVFHDNDPPFARFNFTDLKT